MNHKNERIKHLWERGMTSPEQIARKTGLPLERVIGGLKFLQEQGDIRISENERQALKIMICVDFYKTGMISAEDLVKYMQNQKFVK